MDVFQAKKIIKHEFSTRGLDCPKLTAKTVDFTDLARAEVVFVKIHGWVPGSVMRHAFRSENVFSPTWDELKFTAQAYGFRIQLEGGL